MSFLGATSVPFDDCDTDEQTVNATGGTFAAIFTNLGKTVQRELLVTNNGSKTVYFGKSVATARYPIAPGDSLRLAAKDLAKIALKCGGADTTTVDLIQII